MSLLIGGHAAATERDARGYRLLMPGVQGPNVGAPEVIRRIVVRQETPDHPRSQFWVGPPPVPAQIPHRRALIVGQEMPGHPGSRFHAGTPPLSYEDVQVFLIH